MGRRRPAMACDGEDEKSHGLCSAATLLLLAGALAGYLPDSATEAIRAVRQTSRDWGRGGTTREGWG
ncbi:Uu.00g068510.m01.CDS01 [Anthostomella pinea]|uniref:Uu.00g068510.m01.CDS01 n=1 Tax=Anthostomella pinea TaxID=933095 RepID=A0AAI8YNL2_9PEZI|nr:Uu.00g068510.m01.CDS01 [Anthostomella pinea]